MYTTVIGIKRMIAGGDAATEWHLVMATAIRDAAAGAGGDPDAAVVRHGPWWMREMSPSRATPAMNATTDIEADRALVARRAIATLLRLLSVTASLAGLHRRVIEAVDRARARPFAVRTRSSPSTLRRLRVLILWALRTSVLRRAAGSPASWTSSSCSRSRRCWSRRATSSSSSYSHGKVEFRDVREELRRPEVIHG